MNKILPEFGHSGVFASNRYVNFHSHPGTELVLLSTGRCKMEVVGKLLEGGPGTLFILPAKKVHSQINEGFVRTFYFSFLGKRLFDETPRLIDLKGDRWIKTWMKHIYLMSKAIHSDSRGTANGIIYSVLKRVEELEESINSSTIRHPAIESAMEYIERHLGEQVTLEGMAEYSGVSASYLSCLFKKEFGKGPVAISLESKMQYAEKLLEEPYYSIKETAFACGFSDPNYFSRFFRKYRNCSPEEYRKKLKSNT